MYRFFELLAAFVYKHQAWASVLNHPSVRNKFAISENVQQPSKSHLPNLTLRTGKGRKEMFVNGFESSGINKRISFIYMQTDCS